MAVFGAVPRPGHAQAVQPVTVQVSLSRLAAARMASLHEGVTVSATFSGDPLSAARRQTDERGQIGLATEEVTIHSPPGVALITGAGVTAGKLRLLRNQTVHLLINVFSARRALPDNILACGLFDDTAALAARNPVRINCKLISEGF